ncbi:MAG: M50 family metallopeptidase, partial [Thermomicrobium sp.]
MATTPLPDQNPASLFRAGTHGHSLVASVLRAERHAANDTYSAVDRSYLRGQASETFQFDERHGGSLQLVGQAGMPGSRKRATMQALYIVPILAVLILVHELGHFLAARLFGIRVLEFGIGLPPRLFGIRRGGVLYSINAIPLGGFVRVVGEDSRADEPDSLQNKPRWQRAIFFGAGALMNLLLAFLVMMLLVGFRGQPQFHLYVAEVVADSPAAAAGWQPGDRIVALDGQPVRDANQLIERTEQAAGRPLRVTVL